MMKQISTVLFDFDGTVMDTREVILQSWQYTFRTLEGKEHDPAEIYRTFGEPLEYTMRDLFPHVDVREAVDIYRSYHKNNFGELIRVFPGVSELLERLKADGYQIGLVTSRLKNTTVEGLEAYGLLRYFDDLVTCDDTAKHKPDPEPILAALRKLNSKPEQAVMVGDTMFDIGCARNAGVMSVLVNWSVSVSEEEKTGSDGPDFVIDKAADLLKILE